MPSRRVIKSVKKSANKSSRKVVKKSANKSSRKVVKKSVKKVVKKSANKSSRKVAKKSAKKSVRKVVKKSVKKSVKKVVKKSEKKSVRKVVKKSRKSPKASPKNKKYPVCFLFGVHFVDDEESGRVNVNALSKKAKALLSEPIIKECSNGFGVSDFYVKNISITFQDDANIRVEGSVDIDPKSESFGATLKEWVEVVDEKSIYQTMYGGPTQSKYYVESNGKKYALRSVKMC